MEYLPSHEPLQMDRIIVARLTCSHAGRSLDCRAHRQRLPLYQPHNVINRLAITWPARTSEPSASVSVT
jgi:hypothetical protein